MSCCPSCGEIHAPHLKFCPEDGTPLPETAQYNDDGSFNSSARLGAEFGPYRLTGVLGEGGMGTVYLAEHMRLGRQVAVKFLHPEYAVNPNLVKRFFGEARVVNQVAHDHIVEITDFVGDGEETYIVMELLAGENLSELLKHEGFLSIPRVLSIGSQVCNALVAVHAAEVVHRDLKPANIFITDRPNHPDYVKLLDFGIAKLTEAMDGESLAETAAGAVLGTPGYVAPEQLTGKPVDGRADVYAVGVLLYQMLTGRKPLSAKSFGEMVLKQLTATPLRPSELDDMPHVIPSDLEDLILQCLERDPEDRPATVAELEERLDAIAIALTTGETRVTTFTPRLSHKHLVPAIAVALGIVAVGIGAALGLRGSRHAVPVPPQHDAVATPTETEAAFPPQEAAEESTTKSTERRVIEIAFESTPTSAEIFLEGSEEPLGLAPLSLTLKRSSESQTFEFRLAGHQTTRRVVPLSADRRVRVQLVPNPPSKQIHTPSGTLQRRRTTRTRPRRGPRTHPKSRRGTLDPFAD